MHTHVHAGTSRCVSMSSCIRAYSDVVFVVMPLKTSHASSANLATGDPPPPLHTHTYMHWPGIHTAVTVGRAKLRDMSVFINKNVREKKFISLGKLFRKSAKEMTGMSPERPVGITA